MSDRADERGGKRFVTRGERRRPPPQFLRAAQSFAVLAALGAGFASFWGLRDFFVSGGLVGWLLPLSLAIVVAGLVAFLWHVLLELAADA